MKRAILLITLLLPLTIFAESVSFWDIYKEQLKSDVNYQTSILQLKKAENEVSSYENFWNPIVSVNTLPSITIDASGIVSPSMEIGVDFLNVFGTKIGVNFPFTIQTNDSWKVDWKNPNLSFTRNLFDESYANELSARAGYYSALWNLKNSQWEVLIDTVQNIVDWKYYQSLVSEYDTKVGVLRKLYLDEKDSTKKENFHKQLLSSTNSLLSYKNSLDGLKENIPYSATLYDEVLSPISNLTKSATKDLNMQDVIEKRMDVKAKELQYEAAREKAFLWFLPFVPNPSFSLNLFRNDDKLKWSLSISLSFTIFDKGDNVTQSFSRKENEKISQIQLQNIRDSVGFSLENLMNSLKISKNNIELQKIEVEDSQRTLDTANELYKKGFESEDEMMLSKIGYQVSLIEFQHTQDDMLLILLRILQARGVELGGEQS